MLSIIIPTLNEEQNIEALLQGLAPQINPQDEIIVVDSYSKDSTAKIAKKHGAKVLLKPKKGVGLARTEGAKMARNEILVFLDADCNPSKDFTKRIRRHFSESKVVAVGGLDLYHSDSNIKKWFYNTYSVGVFHLVRINH